MASETDEEEEEDRLLHRLRAEVDRTRRLADDAATQADLTRAEAATRAVRVYTQALLRAVQAAQVRRARQEARLAAAQARLAAEQALWVRMAMQGALADSRRHWRSVLTGRCLPYL